MDLVQRDGRRLVLTQIARDYAADIREALNQIAQASLRLQSAPVAGALNLAILPTFGMRWLMPRLPDFGRRHPDVTINMTTRLVPFNFSGEAFDAAIHYGQADWPGTDHMLLKSEQVIAVCAPDLPGLKSLGAPRDVMSVPLLHIQTRPDAWRDWLATKGVTTDRADQGAMYDQFSTITQAALQGMGVALMPDYIVEQDLAAGRLIAPFGAPIEASGAYFLVWPHSKSRHPALCLFRDWLQGQAQPEDPLPR